MGLDAGIAGLLTPNSGEGGGRGMILILLCCCLDGFWFGSVPPLASDAAQDD